jgi:hypothetical protein
LQKNISYISSINFSEIFIRLCVIREFHVNLQLITAGIIKIIENTCETGFIYHNTTHDDWYRRLRRTLGFVER